jgi:large subunit ribosomal protein L18
MNFQRVKKMSFRRGLPFRRRLESKTNYKKRLALLKSGKPRLVIRRSHSNIQLQIIEYFPTGDKTILSAYSSELRKFGWPYSCGNLPAAYLTGLLLGMRAAKSKILDCVPDLGLYDARGGTSLYSAIKGAIDGGLKVPCSKSVFPSEERIRGEHIQKYALYLKKKSPAAYNKQFGGYLKANIFAEEISKVFDNTKRKILGD